MEIEPNEQKSTINDEYLIVEKKGKGAYATVYLVKEPNTNQFYAAKVLKENTSTFQAEIQILDKISKLHNPYIVNLVKFGEGPIKIASKPETNKQYLILEYASKGELFDYIFCSQKGLKEKYVKVVFKKILKGVDAIHKSGICHRDLKMQNILVDEKFNPKICDFGFACETGSGKLNQFLGTMNYAAPEMFYHRPYDGVKADIFSLGVVLLNLSTCKIGFCQSTKKDKYYRHIILKNYETYWNLVKSQIGEISPELKTLYLKMVAFNPEERPTIDQILVDPWMKEINDLNEQEYSLLEKEIYEEFLEMEKKVNANNEKLSCESSSDIAMGNTRGLEGDVNEYFELNLTPKYCLKTGLNMKNYLKIQGALNPSNFMNSLASKFKSKFKGCDIEAEKNKLKFNVVFENEEEEVEETEEDKKINEELDKLKLENIDEFEEGIQKKESIVQVKLFESANGGYVLRFAKKGGEIEDYHQNLDKIILATKELI